MDLDDPLRAVSWNHIKPHIVAVGSFSGKITLIDCDNYKVIQELIGCTDKVFSLKWHPFFDYILASGSSDEKVRVWDTKNVSLFNFIIAREWAQKLGVS